MEHDSMKNALATDKKRNGYSKRLYKAESDAYKGDVLQGDIMERVALLQQAQKRSKVNWNDINDVRQRTYNYLSACADASAFPSVMGLAVYGYGITRQALNQYLLAHPNTPATDFINQAKDIMADILTNASLNNNANPVQVIFQLKNHFGHSDRVEIEPIPPETETLLDDADEIATRYIVSNDCFDCDDSIDCIE